MESLQKQLEVLFVQAGADHAEAYFDSDGEDPEWPMWYADHMLESLRELLASNFTKSDLVYLLVQASREHGLRAPGSNRARFYARFFLERYDF